jgi:hypothetical protein
LGNPCFVGADDKLRGLIVNETLKKICFCFCIKIFTGTKLFFSTFHSQSTPICHLPAAGAKNGDFPKTVRCGLKMSPWISNYDADCVCMYTDLQCRDPFASPPLPHSCVMKKIIFFSLVLDRGKTFPFSENFAAHITHNFYSPYNSHMHTLSFKHQSHFFQLFCEKIYFHPFWMPGPEHFF